LEAVARAQLYGLTSIDPSLLTTTVGLAADCETIMTRSKASEQVATKGEAAATMTSRQSLNADSWFPNALTLAYDSRLAMPAQDAI
jgi:hypothetical protein